MSQLVTPSLFFSCGEERGVAVPANNNRRINDQSQTKACSGSVTPHP
jgi:hypothetical protein